MEEQDDSDEAVSGATAQQLAKAVYNVFKETYHLDDKYLAAAWQGTVCDGQYQAKDYGTGLNRLLDRKGTFAKIIWDPLHLLDVAIKEVIDGKRGSYKAFIKRLIDRASAFVCADLEVMGMANKSCVNVREAAEF